MPRIEIIVKLQPETFDGSNERFSHGNSSFSSTVLSSLSASGFCSESDKITDGEISSLEDLDSGSKSVEFSMAFSTSSSVINSISSTVPSLSNDAPVVREVEKESPKSWAFGKRFVGLKFNAFPKI